MLMHYVPEVRLVRNFEINNKIANCTKVPYGKIKSLGILNNSYFSPLTLCYELIIHFNELVTPITPWFEPLNQSVSDTLMLTREIMVLKNNTIIMPYCLINVLYIIMTP